MHSLDKNLVRVIRDIGNVSKFEINIAFPGVTKAILKLLSV